MGRYHRLCAVSLGCCLAQPAWAQQDVSPPATVPSSPAFSGTKQGEQPPESPTGPQAKGPLAGIGRKLADDGITFRALVDNELAGNTTGGANQGTRNVGQVYIGADIDFSKLVGWKGGHFHVTLYRDYGHGLSKEVTGTFFKQQDIYKNPYTQLHLGLVAFEQTFDHDKLDVIVGRLGSTAFYSHLQDACYFQTNISCGIPAVLSSEAGNSLLPSATWGANVRYKLTKQMYLESGAFEVNPTIAPTNGFVVSTAGATGFTVPVELGYENNNFKTVRYPSEWKVGAYFSTGDRVDPFYNAAGTSAGLTNTKQRTATSLRDGIYVLGGRTVWRPDPKSLESVSLFGGFIQPLEGEEVITRQIYGGAVLRAPFRSRPRDSIGFSVGWLHVGSKELAYLRDNRIRLGGDAGDESPEEIALELSYGLAVGRSIRVTPNVQYTINPESSSLPKIDFVPHNILTFGLKVTANVATLLGLPSAAAASD